MPGRRTVFFSTNYPMAWARQAWARGEYPGHHLWGATALEQDGFDVRFLDSGKELTAAQHLRSRLRYHFGDGSAQRHVLGVPRSGALAYAADPSTFASLAALRASGLLRMPVMAAIHPRVPQGGPMKRWLSGYDATITFSRLIHEQLLMAGHAAERTLHAPLGPDLTWRQYQPGPFDIVVSSGKTYRDEPLLLRALHNAGLPAIVHTGRIEGETREREVLLVGRAGYPRVLADLRRASVVAIPLSQVDGTYGVTELRDALALGKPVVMTRNPYVDVDLESIGCGYTVEPGDVGGWSEALTALHGDPQRAQAMGARGRAFAEREWNLDTWNSAVIQSVRALAG